MSGVIGEGQGGGENPQGGSLLSMAPNAELNLTSLNL